MKHAQVPWVEATPVHQGIQVRCSVCGAVALARTPQLANEFALQHREHRSASPEHYGAGDAVAGLTKALGFKQGCTPCEARRNALNAALPKLWPRRG